MIAGLQISIFRWKIDTKNSFRLKGRLLWIHILILNVCGKIAPKGVHTRGDIVGLGVDLPLDGGAQLTLPYNGSCAVTAYVVDNVQSTILLDFVINKIAFQPVVQPTASQLI